MTQERHEILKARVVDAFRQAFARSPELLVAAPGRVNLIGEHTDYNDGFVLPCAIDYETIIAISPAADGQITAIVCDYENARDRFDPALSYAPQKEEWKNHLRAIVASLAANGHQVGGANIAVAGNIPQGAGLSSSASLGVALAKALAETNNLQAIGETQLALVAQQAENDFVGCACGIMDQLASARSKVGHAMLLDCRSLEIQHIPVPDDLAILIVHSGIARGLVDSAYNERRKQCEHAARHYGVAALRDLNMEQLISGKGDLDDVSFRRARHVVSENARTLNAAGALAAGDMEMLGQLMQLSHASMRDDFEITLSAIDRLAEIIAAELDGEGGARMTGGGFGGCVVALLQQRRLDSCKAAVHAEYRDPQANPALTFTCQPSEGASLID